MAEIKIALAGNPNSGKTTMFNALTGSSQYVGNWPGVTVERKEGRLKGNKEVIIQDLPGIYSLAPYTLEEVVSRNYLINERPDAIINLIDGSNLERNLYLTTQLCEIGIPMVLALNMSDIVEKTGDKIDIKKLGEAFGCEVVETSAVKGTGVKEIAQKALELAQTKKTQAPVHEFDSQVEEAILSIANIIKDKCKPENLRWYAVKVFERDDKAIEQLKLSAKEQEESETIIAKMEDLMDDDSESIITNERYNYISGVMKKAVKKKNPGQLSVSDKIDKIVTNRFLALPIFALVMFLVYFLSVSTVGVWMTDWVNETLFGEWVPNALNSFLENVHAAGWLQGLIVDGIVGGVGAVLGFVPQMAMLFICLAILEDCGYMARIAFIMDRIFRKFGLSGKSFIPMLISSGCAVPGIMASRTIENDKDRRMTVMTTSFIPCGAKLPIIALIAGALFNESGLVATASYFIGVAAILFSGIVLKKTKLFAGDPAPFVMELPAYHAPRVKGVLLSTWERLKAFIRKAGTIILVSSVVIWFLSNFSWRMKMVDMEESMLASIGNVIAPIFIPLGWGNWRAAVATVTGLAAKENVVATFGILYGGIEVATENGAEIWAAVASSFTAISGFSFLVFNLLCAPCFAAIGAIKREMASAKWTAAALVYQTALAYAVSMIVYQIGGLFTGEVGFGVGSIVAILLILFAIWLIFRKGSKNENNRTLSVNAVK